jgi:hypothetical protein
MSKQEQELVADLYYIVEYAKSLRKKVVDHQGLSTADAGFAQRMKDLATKVHNTVNAQVTSDK